MRAHYLRNSEKIKAYARAYYQKNRERQILLRIAYRFGIAVEQYKSLIDKQNNRCAICGDSETAIDHRSKEIRRLSIDHDHKSGALRGLLCQACNNGLGCFRDDPERMKAAIKYLKRS